MSYPNEIIQGDYSMPYNLHQQQPQNPQQLQQQGTPHPVQHSQNQHHPLQHHMLPQHLHHQLHHPVQQLPYAIPPEQTPQLPYDRGQIHPEQAQQALPPVSERKSRRTHKNSRDGCPNCKAKRIKCTEELPQCANCVKKKYRCSYLDFPKEKLDRIREKNAAKALDASRQREESESGRSLREETESSGLPENGVLDTNNEDSTNTPSNRSDSLSDNNLQHSSTPSSNTSNISPSFSKDKLQHKRRRSNQSAPLGAPLSRHLQKPIIDNFQTDQPFANISTLRTFVYKNSMLKLANDIGGPFLNSIYDDFVVDQKFKPWDTFDSYTNNENLIDDFTISHDSQDDSSYAIAASNINYGNNVQLHEEPRLYQEPAPEKSLPVFSPSNDMAPPPTGQTKSLNKIAIYNNSKFKKPKTHPLPNAMNIHKTFRKLDLNESMKNKFLKKYLTRYQSDIKLLKNDEFQFTYQPVWNKSISASFWITVYNQSEVLDLYFSFFMDRALNFILNVGNKIANVGSSANSSPSNYLLVNSVSPTSTLSSDFHSPDPNSDALSNPGGTAEYVNTLFDHRTVTLLTKKLYNHYGNLILDLRKSLTNYHIEFPTKISMFSAWSSFLHLHATVDSLSLMYNGTAILILKIVDEAVTTNDISPTIKVSLEIFNSHTLTSRVNDYPFDVIHEIHHAFKQFKILFEGLKVHINEKGEDCTKRRKSKLDSELSPFKNTDEYVVQKFLNNKNFQHDVNELDKFFDKLINEYYPNFLRINGFFKGKYNDGLRRNSFTYVSFSLLFEMLVHWFKIFPSDVLSMGSKANPFKKTFYLFYLALGRALVHVITPIRYMMVIDACHVFCPLFNFEADVYKFEAFENLIYNDQAGNVEDIYYQFNTLNGISTNLIRMVKFFDYRTLFYSYYLAGTSVLDEEYLKAIQEDNELGTGTYNDVLKVIPDTLDIDEEFITSFQYDSIKLNNFPQFKQFKQNRELSTIIEQELMRVNSLADIRYDDNKFDYENGLFKYDFDPAQLLDKFSSIQEGVWESKRPTLEKLRNACHNYELGRKEIKKAIEFQALFKQDTV